MVFITMYFFIFRNMILTVRQIVLPTLSILKILITVTMGMLSAKKMKNTKNLKRNVHLLRKRNLERKMNLTRTVLVPVNMNVITNNDESGESDYSSPLRHLFLVTL